MSEEKGNPVITESSQNNQKSELQGLMSAISGIKVPKYFISIFLTILYLIIAIYLMRVSRNYVRKIVTKINKFDENKEEHKKKVDTISSVSLNILTTIVWLFTLTFILSAWGVSIGPILAGAGIMGVALGLGAQSFLRDIISGFVIMFTGYINIGDNVQIKEHIGRVKEITLSAIVLQTRDNNDVYIPNGSIDVIAKLK